MVNQTRDGLDRGRQHFGFVDGLRALAMLAVVGYEIVRHLPPAGVPPGLLRAASSGANAVVLFFVISGFVLAYPVLSELHHKRGAEFDPALYAFKRAARIFPAYLAVLALLVLVPLAGRSYGVAPLAGAVPSLGALLRQAVFMGDGLGNDGMWTLGVTVRLYVLFPLLLLLWTRARIPFYGIALLAAGADALTPAHGWALGALVPFMLGIVAADALLAEHWLGRFAFVFAVAAGVVGAALDPLLARLPGPAGTPVPFPENPFWAVAFAALILCAGRAPYCEQVLEFAPLRLLGGMSFALSLTVVPAVAFAARQLATSPAPRVALSSFALTMACGFALWQSVDRWFADPKLHARATRRLDSYLDRHAGRWPRHRVRLLAAGEPAEPVTRNAAVTLRQPRKTPNVLLERVAEERGPVVTMRTGFQADLAAEILETRRRLAEHAATYFAQESAARHATSREPVAAGAARLERGPVAAGAARLEAGPAETAEEADPLAAALGRGVTISVRSHKKPK